MTACIPTLIYQLIVCIITIYYPLLTSTSSYVSNLPLLITVPWLRHPSWVSMRRCHTVYCIGRLLGKFLQYELVILLLWRA